MTNEIKTISINCQSCGAGLQKDKDYCKCNYCGNVNIILRNGRTRIVIGDYYVNGKNINPSKEDIPLKWYVILLLGLFTVTSLIWVYKTFKKQEEDSEFKLSTSNNGQDHVFIIEE